MQPGSEPTRRKESREDQQQHCLSAVFPSEEIAIKSAITRGEFLFAGVPESRARPPRQPRQRRTHSAARPVRRSSAARFCTRNRRRSALKRRCRRMERRTACTRRNDGRSRRPSGSGRCPSTPLPATSLAQMRPSSARRLRPPCNQGEQCVAIVRPEKRPSDSWNVPSEYAQCVPRIFMLVPFDRRIDADQLANPRDSHRRPPDGRALRSASAGTAQLLRSTYRPDLDSPPPPPKGSAHDRAPGDP